MELSWKRNLFCVWLSQILAMAGFAAIYPFVPIFFRDVYGMTDPAVCGVWVAVLIFCGMFSFCAAAPLWGYLADRFGRKLMLLRSYYVTGLLFPVLYFAPNVYWFIAIRFLVSAFSGTVTAAQTLVVTNTPRERQGFALGALSTALWSGNMVGFVIGGVVVNTFGFFWSFMICGVLYLIGGILVQFLVQEDFERAPRRERKKSNRLGREVFAGWTSAIRWILLIFLVMGMARRFDEPFLALLVEAIHGTADTAFYTGLICAAAAVGGIASGFVVGKLCDRTAPEKIAIPMIAGAVAAMLVQAFATDLTVLAVARFITFFCAGGLEPAFQTLLARNASDEEQGSLFGWASSSRMLGIMLAAAVGGGVIYCFGIRGIFVAAAVLMLALLPLLACLAKTQKQDVPPRQAADSSPGGECARILEPSNRS